MAFQYRLLLFSFFYLNVQSLMSERGPCGVVPEARAGLLPGGIFPISPGTGWFQEYWEPCVGCEEDTRVGPAGDGGKWVCNPNRLFEKNKCAVLSIGSNNDFRFEREIAEKWGCVVHVYDASSNPPIIIEDNPNAKCPRNWCLLPKAVENLIVFHHKFLGTGDDDKFITLSSAVSHLLESTGASSVDLLKIDCEGCEFTTLKSKDSLKTISSSIKQVEIELHFAMFKDQFSKSKDEKFADSDTRMKFSSFKDPDYIVKALYARMFDLWFAFRNEGGLIPFHKEPNMAYTYGDCIEYALLNVRFASQFRSPLAHLQRVRHKHQSSHVNRTRS